jgi:hypothetical protein
MWYCTLFGTYANCQLNIVGRVLTRHVGLKPDLQRGLQINMVKNASLLATFFPLQLLVTQLGLVVVFGRRYFTHH